MNQELIDTAKEVGLLNETDEEYFVKVLRIEAFAALVAAAEREACAKMCDYVYNNIVTDEHIKDMAFKIRARGETK
jgi:hypothetical protein